MKNLVLGLVKGYSFEQLRPFVVSLKETGYSGDICFLYSELAPETVQSLRDYGVQLIPFTQSSINIGAKSYYYYQLPYKFYRSSMKRFLPLHKIYAGLVNLLSWRRRGSDYVTKSRIATKFLNVYCIRFPLYYLFLAQNKDKYSNVMITDVRDVIFQRDPFDFEFGDELCCFLEDSRVTIEECPINTAWLTTGFSPTVVNEIGRKTISCSGVNIGSYSAIMKYLEVMIDHMLLLKSHGNGIDQGVHNYVLHRQFLKNVKLYSNGSGPVFTMGRTTDSFTSFNTEGLVINPDGSVPNVLHQYDRHIELEKLNLSDEGETIRLRAS